MRRGDESEIPEVTRGAQGMRPFFDALKDDAIRLGLLPKDVDVTTATTYLTRVYNTQKIIAERGAWDGKLFDWLSVQRHSNSKRLGKLKDKIAAAKKS